MTSLTGFRKDLSIMRQTASKVAAMSWEVLPESQQTLEGLITYAETWLAYYVYGPLRFGVQPFTVGDAESSANGPVSPSQVTPPPDPVSNPSRVPDPSASVQMAPPLEGAPQWEQDYWGNRIAKGSAVPFQGDGEIEDPDEIPF